MNCIKILIQNIIFVISTIVESTHSSFEGLVEKDGTGAVVDKEWQRRLWTVVPIVIVPERFQTISQRVLLVVLGANPGYDASYGFVVRKHPVSIQPHYGRCIIAELTPCKCQI